MASVGGEVPSADQPSSLVGAGDRAAVFRSFASKTFGSAMLHTPASTVRLGPFVLPHERSTVSFLRRGKRPGDLMVFACNFTPVTFENYRLGVPSGGYWKELLNSDATLYGGAAKETWADSRQRPCLSMEGPFH